MKTLRRIMYLALVVVLVIGFFSLVTEKMTPEEEALWEAMGPQSEYVDETFDNSLQIKLYTAFEESPSTYKQDSVEIIRKHEAEVEAFWECIKKRAAEIKKERDKKRG